MTLLALVNLGGERGGAFDRIARHVSRSTRVVLAAWNQIELDHERVRLVGPVVELDRDRERRIVEPEAPSAIWMYPHSNSTAYEAASRRFTQAADRGVITNAAGPFGRFGRKDSLELLLRHFTRATGRRVSRPETYCVDGRQVEHVVASLRRRGMDAIVKPANGARGEGVRIIAGDGDHGAQPAGEVVVQALLAAPLLLSGHKIDARAYLVIDTADPRRSRRIGPILLRQALAPYLRGRIDSEITNTSHRRRSGHAPAISVLENEQRLPTSEGVRLRRAVDEICAELLASVRWFGASQRPARRMLLWGIDLGLAEHGAELLEVNPYPQLLRGDPECDQAVLAMLAGEYVRMVTGGGA